MLLMRRVEVDKNSRPLSLDIQMRSCTQCTHNSWLSTTLISHGRVIKGLGQGIDSGKLCWWW